MPDRPSSGPITIGQFRLMRLSEYDEQREIWIERVGDGEGGQFDEAELEKVIEEFYRERF